MSAPTGEQMRGFWNERAREDAYYFVDTRQRYKARDPRRFWEDAPPLDPILGGLGVGIEPGFVVLEIGCGIGRFTRQLAARARRVLALDVSDEMLRRACELNSELGNVTWMLGDGVSLSEVDDHTVDACVSLVVFQHLPDPEITLGYIREIGRVLRPGGWAAVQVSNDPRVHVPPRGLRERAAALVGLAPKGQRHPAWLGSAVDLAALTATATAAGMSVEGVQGEGTLYCLVLLRKNR